MYYIKYIKINMSDIPSLNISGLKNDRITDSFSTISSQRSELDVLTDENEQLKLDLSKVQNSKYNKPEFTINKLTIAFIIIFVLFIICIVAVISTSADITSDVIVSNLGLAGISLLSGILGAIAMVWIASYSLSNLEIQIPDYIKNTFTCPQSDESCNKENIRFTYREPLINRDSEKKTFKNTAEMIQKIQKIVSKDSGKPYVVPV